MNKKVVIYQDGLLSYSETFIKQQAVRLKHWSPILLGHKYLKNSLDFSMLGSQLLIPPKASPFKKARYIINRWLNKADPTGLATLEELSPKLIHAHFGTSAVDIWPYAKALQIPMLVTLHGFDISIRREWWESGKRGYRKKKYPQLLDKMSRGDNVHFIAVSSAIRDRAIAFGIPPEKITVSYIGVDTQQFQSDQLPILQRSNKIIYVGRLVEKKGALYLLEAFVKVKSQIPDAELVIVGTGPLKKLLTDRVQSLKIKDVTFTGAQNNQQVKALIDQAKIFCLPSITAESGDAEGLPISILEAQASGVFVVTSSSGGLGDNLIHKKTCLFFQEKNVDELAQHLLALLTKSQDYLYIIENQLNLINEKFQLAHCTEELEKLYDKFALK